MCTTQATASWCQVFVKGMCWASAVSSQRKHLQLRRTCFKQVTRLICTQHSRDVHTHTHTHHKCAHAPHTHLSHLCSLKDTWRKQRIGGRGRKGGPLKPLTRCFLWSETSATFHLQDRINRLVPRASNQIPSASS